MTSKSYRNKNAVSSKKSTSDTKTTAQKMQEAELDLKSKKRKEKAISWATRVPLDPAIAKQHGTTISSCRAVINQYAHSSLDGSFVNCKQSTIAKKIGICRKTVIRATKALRDMDLMHIDYQYKVNAAGERKRTTSYTYLSSFKNLYREIKKKIGIDRFSCNFDTYWLSVRNFSISDIVHPLFNSLNKDLENYDAIDKQTGEVLPIKVSVKRLIQYQHDKTMLGRAF